METHTLDMILTVIVLSFWFLFPVGMFLSVSHLDKNTDQILRLDHLRHDSMTFKKVVKNSKNSRPFFSGKHIFTNKWNTPLSH